MLDALQHTCEGAFPDRRDLRVGDLTPLAAGWETEISVFTLSYTEDDQSGSQRLILRVYPCVDASDTSGREFYALQRLHRIGFPVPQVYYLGLFDGGTPRPFLLMEYVEGTLLIDAVNQASPDIAGQLFTRFCTTLADLHHIDWRRCIPVPGPGVSQNPYVFVDSFLGLIDDACKDTASPVIQNLLAPASEWLHARRNDIPCERFCALHKDYHLNNVIVRPDGRFCVIDWSQFGIGDPRFDLAWTSILISTYGHPERREAFLAGYEAAGGASPAHFEIFEALAAVARLYVIASSLQGGAESIGLRPEASTRITRDAAHIQRVYDIFRTRTDLRLPAVERMIDKVSDI